MQSRVLLALTCFVLVVEVGGQPQPIHVNEETKYRLKVNNNASESNSGSLKTSKSNAAMEKNSRNASRNASCNATKDDGDSAIGHTDENLLLPACINNTTRPSNTRQGNNQENSTVFDTNRTDCSLLSPQILTCDAVIRPANASLYYVENGTLYWTTCNRVLALPGDYVITPDDNIITCRELIHPKYPHITRCQRISMSQSEFDELLSDPDSGWTQQEKNRILSRPQLVKWNSNGSRVDFCYPLTIQLINCESIMQMPDHMLEIRQDHTLYVPRMKTRYGRGEHFSNNAWEVVCYQEEINDIVPLLYNVCNYFYVLSAVSLLTTLIFLLITTTVNDHIKCLLCHIVCMFVMYSGEAVHEFIGVIVSEANCYVLFVVKYISTISAFLWLNVLAYDVLVFFSCMPTARFRCYVGGGLARYSHYSVYAWGVPVLLCALALIVNNCDTIQRALFIFPGITHNCWFSDRSSTWLFYDGPLAIISLTNLTFFVVTVINLKYASKGLEVVNNNHSKRLLTVCCKLFVTMGVCWLSEVITFTINENYKYDFRYVSEFIISLQGFAIFLVYVIRRENLTRLRRLRRLCFTDDRVNQNTNNSNSGKVPVHYTESNISVMTYLSNYSNEDPTEPIRQ